MSNRQSVIQEFEKSRENEVKLDLHAFRKRCGGTFATLFFLFAVTEGLGLMNRTLQFGFILLALISVLSALIVWLRLWASYVERRLDDIEAYIAGVEPSYYKAEGCDQVSYAADGNTLHCKLNQLREELGVLIDQQSAGREKR